MGTVLRLWVRDRVRDSFRLKVGLNILDTRCRAGWRDRGEKAQPEHGTYATGTPGDERA